MDTRLPRQDRGVDRRTGITIQIRTESLSIIHADVVITDTLYLITASPTLKVLECRGTGKAGGTGQR